MSRLTMKFCSYRCQLVERLLISCFRHGDVDGRANIRIDGVLPVSVFVVIRLVFGEQLDEAFPRLVARSMMLIDTHLNQDETTKHGGLRAFVRHRVPVEFVADVRQEIADERLVELLGLLDRRVVEDGIEFGQLPEDRLPDG